MNRSDPFGFCAKVLTIPGILFLVFALWLSLPALASPNEACLVCHGRQDLVMAVPNGKEMSLHVDRQVFQSSSHGRKLCTDCHSGVKEIPHSLPVAPVNCSKCHFYGSKTGVSGKEYQQYRLSIHAQVKDRRMRTATCQSCHGTHDILPATDERSRINKVNISRQCGQCHVAAFQEYARSFHGKALLEGKFTAAASCSDCHSAHLIVPTHLDKWQALIIQECGSCHKEQIETYNRTYHGKVTKLGYYGTVAKCSDCHGKHKILPPHDPESTLSAQNAAGTCRKCHPQAGSKFANFYAHAEESNRVKYPLLFIVYWFMTLLMIGVFTFFISHTLLWLQRSAGEHLRIRRERGVAATGGEVFVSVDRTDWLTPPGDSPEGFSEEEQRYYHRLMPYHRFLHVLVIISFMGLVITGMPLKYSTTPWAQFLSHLVGGFQNAGFIHRSCAVITFAYFALHLLFVLYYVGWVHKFRFNWLGPDSMVPWIQDLKDLWSHARWFLWMGPRPQFDRWTYWEKFDYLAVFWGVGMIGLSGLFLWFPEYLSTFLPGWWFNVATIIHSDEALLAAGFIFTIHFFNTHFQPGKFPLDMVAFTGRISIRELKRDRPMEYQRLVASGQLEKRLIGPPHPWLQVSARAFGLTVAGLGVIMLLLILWAQFIAQGG